MRLFPLLILVALAGCGADGAPERPEAGVTMTGEARVGIVSTQ